MKKWEAGTLPDRCPPVCRPCLLMGAEGAVELKSFSEKPYYRHLKLLRKDYKHAPPTIGDESARVNLTINHY